ncbi:MAG: Rieske (2Fe-2S) protein [Nannocystaceae bacterium]
MSTVISQRFPFPTLPRGWFVIAYSPDIAPGEVKTLHYFGEDIVVFRGEDGGLSAVHRYCPHMGAHLGGGEVIGNCLRCPFHHWSFDQEGQCVDIPYAPKIPPKAAVKTWSIREQNGVILCWYCPKGEPPAWEPTPSRTRAGRRSGWSAGRSPRTPRRSPRTPSIART